MSTPTTAPYMPVTDLESDTKTDEMSDLLTTLTDTINGLEAFRERAEPDLITVLDEFIALHRDHQRELANVAMWDLPEDAGEASAMTFVHRSIAWMRDLTGDVDADLLPQVISGEENVAQAYADAIGYHEGTSEQGRILMDQRAALEALIGKHSPAG